MWYVKLHIRQCMCVCVFICRWHNKGGKGDVAVKL